MKINILAAFVILIVVVSSKPVLAQESIIQDISNVYVDKLVATAKANYPRYKSFKNKVDIARSNVTLATLTIFDAFTLSYIYQPGTTTFVDPVNPTTSYFRGLQAGVFLNLGSLLRTPVNIRKAKTDLRIAQNDQDEYDLTLATEVKKRYYTYIMSMATLKLQSRNMQQAEAASKDAEYKYKKGELIFDTYNKTQIQYTQNIQTKIEAEGNLFIAKASLEEILGDKLENIK